MKTRAPDRARCRPFSSLLLASALLASAAAAEDFSAMRGANHVASRKAVPQQRWTADEAWAWYRARPWIVGFNFVPSTAGNTTEFWAAETFDEKTIDRELGWAQG